MNRLEDIMLRIAERARNGKLGQCLSLLVHDLECVSLDDLGDVEICFGWGGSSKSIELRSILNRKRLAVRI